MIERVEQMPKSIDVHFSAIHQDTDNYGEPEPLKNIMSNKEGSGTWDQDQQPEFFTTC